MATKVKLIETGAVTGNIIPDGGIATGKLADDAVTTIKISDANITHAKLHTSMDLTGKTVTVATAAGSTNTTAAASTAFVQQELTTLIGGAPSTLNDLNELAAAINDDSNYNSTLTTALATKLPLAGGTMTGELGIGVTPGAWSANYPALQIGQGATFTGHISNTQTQLGQNWWVGTGNQYVVNGAASRLVMGADSSITFSQAPSGTAGATMSSITNPLVINASGNATFAGTITATNLGQHQIATTLFAENIIKSSKATEAGGYIRMASSTQSVPTYTFVDDTNTGMFTSGADTLNFTTGGTERLRIDSGGRLLLGTSTPRANSGEIATVNGNISLTNEATYSTSLTRGISYFSSTASYGVQPIANINFHTVGNAQSAISFITRNSAADYSERMRIDSAGNVGIGTGTSAFSYPLTVYSTGTYSAKFHSTTTATTAYNAILVTGGMTSAIGYYGIAGSTASNTSFRDAFVIGTQSAHSLSLNTNDTARITVASSGNVGIGATPSSSKLEVLGLNNIANFYSTSTATEFKIASPTVNKIGIYTGTSDDFFINVGGSDRITILNGGNVGIGTTAPHGKLQFGNDAATRKIVLYEGADNDYQFYGFGVESSTLIYSTYLNTDDHVFVSGASTTSRNELMRITGDGNVGIGETNPKAPGGAGATTLTLKGTDYPQFISVASAATANSTTWRSISRSSNIYQIQTVNDAITTEQTAYQITRGNGSNSITEHRWWGGTTAHMVLDSAGDLTVTGTVNSSYGKFFSGVANEEIQISLGWNATNMWTLGRENATTGDLLFKNGGTSEKLRLTSSGGLVSIASTTGLVGNFTNTSTSGYGLRVTTYGTGAQYGFAVDSYGGGYSRDFTVGADGNVNAHTGNLVIGTAGKGIVFNVTGSTGTSTNGTLDDYEEGTWTPAISGSGGTVTASGANGYYTKVGNLVTVSGTYTWSANGSNANGTSKMTGFPFTSHNVTNGRNVGSFGAINGIAGANSLRFVCDPGYAWAYIITQNGTGYSHNNAFSASGAMYGFTLTYMTTA